VELKTYFSQKRGHGVLSTADTEGRVNAAIYAKPHVIEEDRLAFIMRERLTHENLKANPYAAYLFKEEGIGYNGCRLYLKKIKESDDPEEIRQFQRRKTDDQPDAARFLVFFQVEKILPLIGAGEDLGEW
jgi:hypothetical protein